MATQVPDQDPRNQYTATAGQTIFPYTFLIYDEDSLTVTLNGAPLSLTVDYTVNGLGVLTGGDVTLTSGASAGDVITIVRDMEFDRETDYQDNGDFLAEVVNLDFNRIWLALQQIRGGGNLNLQISPTDDLTGIDQPYYIPLKSDRAGKVLGFDATGNPVATQILEAGTSDADFVFYTDLVGQNKSVTQGIAFNEIYVRNFNQLYVDSGSDNTYELTSAISYAVTGYFPTMKIWFVPANPNPGGASTVAVESLGVKSLKNVDGSDLPAGFMDPARGLYGFFYDGTDFIFFDCATTFSDIFEIQDNSIGLEKLETGTPGTYLVHGPGGDVEESAEPIKQWTNFANSGNLTSGSNFQVTGIPDTATKIDIDIMNVDVTSNTDIELTIGYGSTPTFLNASGDYIGTVITTGPSSASFFNWDEYAAFSVRNSNPTNGGRITMSKFNDGTNDTWSISFYGVYLVSSVDERVMNGNGRVNGASLPAALSALNLDLSAGTFNSGYIAVSVYS